MQKTDSDQTKRSLPALMFQKHFEITYRVIFLTISPLVLFGGGGYLVDKYFGSYPWFLLLGMAIAFPLSQYMVYKTFTSLTAKEHGRTSSQSPL